MFSKGKYMLVAVLIGCACCGLTEDKQRCSESAMIGKSSSEGQEMPGSTPDIQWILSQETFPFYRDSAFFTHSMISQISKLMGSVCEWHAVPYHCVRTHETCLDIVAQTSGLYKHLASHLLSGLP